MTKVDFSLTRFIPLVMSSAMFIAITVPYVIAVVKNNVLSFLPYVSHAAAFPPQSAIFSIFMNIGALFGIFTFLLRFVAVEHRRHRLDPKKIKLLNQVALVVGVFALISFVSASHFPVGFVTHEKHDWVVNVIVPHFFSSALVVTLFTVYILIQSYLTYAQRKKSAMNVSIHASLAMCVVVTNWITCLPFYSAIRELVPNTIDSETGEINLEAQEYSFYYIISSLSGWGFFFLVFLFMASFFRDVKSMNITMTIRHKIEKPVKLDTLEGPIHARKGSNQMTKM